MPTTDAALQTETCQLPDGRTLAYATGGDTDGVPVVVHHGTPGSRLFGSLLAEAASATGVRLVVPDRPGYGQSTVPPAGWTWSDWPDDLAAVRDVASLDRPAHLGFSGGGPFAVAAAAGGPVDRLALVSAVIPPAENALASLARIPYALRALFGVSGAYARLAGPRAVVGQYTDREVSDTVASAVAADFHEALAPGARAVERENRAFATGSLDPPTDVRLRAWHGTDDGNTPLEPIRGFAREAGGTVETSATDHLGTLLAGRRAVLQWLAGA